MTSDKKPWLAVVVGAGLVLNGCAGMSKKMKLQSSVLWAVEYRRLSLVAWYQTIIIRMCTCLWAPA